MISFARVANESEDSDSSTLDAAGETHAIISVFAFPPSESDMRRVSLWFRYGTNDSPRESAEMTSPSAESERLIAWASLSRSAATPDLDTPRMESVRVKV